MNLNSVSHLAGVNGSKNAFPLSYNETEEVKNGISKREYYTGIAVQGLLASGQTHDYKNLVYVAVGIADDILKQLEEIRAIGK